MGKRVFDKKMLLVVKARLPLEIFRIGVGKCKSVKKAIPSASRSCLNISSFSLVSSVSPLY